MSVQVLVERAQDKSFYLAGIGSQISLQDFKEEAEQIDRIVESVLSSSQKTPLTLENRKIITRAVLRTNERMILRLYGYVMKNEGDKVYFHPKTRDNVVRYLNRIKLPTAIPGSKLVDKTNIEHLIKVFNASNTQNNRIDWSVVDRLIFAFDRMQRHSFQINSVL